MKRINLIDRIKYFFLSLIEKKQASIDLTLDEYKVLRALYKEGALSFTTLKVYLNFEIYDLRSTLKDLKEKGYINEYSSKFFKERKIYVLTNQFMLLQTKQPNSIKLL